MACQPNDYICRAQSGEFGTSIGIPSLVNGQVVWSGGGTSTTSGGATATRWWYVAAGIVLIGALIQYAPKLGGWMLLLIVLGLALSPDARGIITGGK